MEHINQGKLLLGSTLITASIWFLFLSIICFFIYIILGKNSLTSRTFFGITFGLGILCLGGGLAAFFVPSEEIISDRGNLIMYPFGMTTANLENRDVIDFNCASLIPESINCEPGSVHGFISVDENDSIKNIPENYGYDVNSPIKATSGFIFSNSWEDLMNGRFNFGEDRNGAKVTEAFWPHGDRTLRNYGPGANIDYNFWSGSNEDGTTNVEKGEDWSGDSYDKGTCNNWTDDSPFTSSKGYVGSLRQIGKKWISSSDNYCRFSSIGGTKNTLLCLCKEKISEEPSEESE